MTPTEIDRQIAEKVYGWEFPVITENTAFRHALPHKGYILNGKIYKFTVGYDSELFSPSTDIKQAFEALDKWGKRESRNYCIWPERVFLWEGTDTWEIPAVQIDITDDNLPLAICRALGQAIQGREKRPTKRKDP